MPITPSPTIKAAAIRGLEERAQAYLEAAEELQRMQETTKSGRVVALLQDAIHKALNEQTNFLRMAQALKTGNADLKT